MYNKHVVRLGLRALIIATAVTAGIAGQAHTAQAAENAAEFVKKGAEAFKANQFYEAAVAFEKAAQLDPADATNLRYAGRAWQEVGHLKRALSLLELYLKIEPDPVRKASIEEKLAPLRTATPHQVAEALNMALTKFPQARLEGDAAKAYEAVGDDASLKRAAELWEIARVRAGSDGDRQAAEAGIARVAQRMLDGKAKREKEDEERKAREAAAKNRPVGDPKAGDPKAGDPKAGDPKAGDPPVGVTKPGATPIAQTAMIVGGGGLTVAGVVVALIGRSQATSANTDYAAGKYAGNRDKYEADRGSSDKLAYAGWGLAAAGVGVLAWGWMTGQPTTPAKTTGWQVLPVAVGDGGMAVLALQF